MIYLRTQGRAGNQVMQYCFARGYAEFIGTELVTDNWIGRKVFQVGERIGAANVQERSELDLVEGEDNICLVGYAQHQNCLKYYTRSKMREWLRFRPEIENQLQKEEGKILAHRRVGDYFGYQYPVVSQKAYHGAAIEYNQPLPEFVTEENPAPNPFTKDLAWVPDFYRLINARVLFRGNSTFSWVAACLSSARIYAPVIEGLEGGKEHDAKFVLGNWPRFCNLDFVTDLHIKE